MAETGVRDLEQRQFAAQQALSAMLSCVVQSNPQDIFTNDAGVSTLDNNKLQSIANRWADTAADTIEMGMRLAQCIGQDALNMFPGTPPASAQRSGA
jgi:hypothetical protein